jgi:hypothetical protein
MLNNNSQAATNANQNGLNAAANAEARQLQALSAAGTTGGAVQGQIYGADVNKANAANAIAQFNAGTQNNNSQFNATTKNQAQASNLQNAQDIANKNTASKQVQQSSASTAQQQAYEDALARASGMAGAYTNQAKNDTTQGQQIGGIYGSVLGSIAKAGAGAPPAPTSGTPPASMATGGEVQAPMSMDCGGAVPGEPQVPGRDTEKNDTVPAMLSPHEVVIPASIAEKRDPREVMQFMRSLPRPERGIHPRAIMDTLKALDQIHTAAVRG